MRSLIREHFSAASVPRTSRLVIRISCKSRKTNNGVDCLAGNGTILRVSGSGWLLPSQPNTYMVTSSCCRHEMMPCLFRGAEIMFRLWVMLILFGSRIYDNLCEVYLGCDYCWCLGVKPTRTLSLKANHSLTLRGSSCLGGAKPCCMGCSAKARRGATRTIEGMEGKSCTKRKWYATDAVTLILHIYVKNVLVKLRDSGGRDQKEGLLRAQDDLMKSDDNVSIEQSELLMIMMASKKK